MARRTLLEDILASLGVLRRRYCRQRDQKASSDYPLEHPGFLPVVCAITRYDPSRNYFKPTGNVPSLF
jgi:hypothetical protein